MQLFHLLLAVLQQEMALSLITSESAWQCCEILLQKYLKDSEKQKMRLSALFLQIFVLIG